METKRTKIDSPFFSVCIPQYNRTHFLIEACKVLSQQTFKDFEVCIADDRSTDKRERELIDYLEGSGLSFWYKKNRENLRYDGNLRASISMASGKFCFLHGNDDCLASSSMLEELSEALKGYEAAGVVITNYEDYRSGAKARRVQKTRLVGSGPEVAASHFRNLSFVSGVLIDRPKAQAYSTDRWDGSEMYQMYMASRIVAGGSNLLELDIYTILKDIQIPNEAVDSYATKPKIKGFSIAERKIPLSMICRLVADAINPYLRKRTGRRILEWVVLQIYLFTYPFWIIEYRRVQSWPYALGICIGMRPENVFLGLNIGLLSTIRLYCLYLSVTITGLVMPISFFKALQSRLHYIAKSMGSRGDK
ncbi:MAG: glycosyltransferase [Candidatus Omnitrophota bacterium]